MLSFTDQWYGSYVWLAPNYTDSPDDAVTSFAVFAVKDGVTGQDDLTKGAGGTFRYQVPQKQSGNNYKVSCVQFLRPGDASDSPPEGFSGISSDINQGRGKTYLYLIWKTTRV